MYTSCMLSKFALSHTHSPMYQAHYTNPCVGLHTQHAQDAFTPSIKPLLCFHCIYSGDYRPLMASPFFYIGYEGKSFRVDSILICNKTSKPRPQLSIRMQSCQAKTQTNHDGET